MARHLLLRLSSSLRLMKRQDSYSQISSSVLNRCLSGRAAVEKEQKVATEDKKTKLPVSKKEQTSIEDSSDENEASIWKSLTELAWLSKALEPAMQLYKWASAGNDEKAKVPPTNRSFSEILSNLQQTRAGIQEWSLSDLTVGLYLMYLSQASAVEVEEFTGVQISSDMIVQELIYYIELAKGSYKDNAAGLARHSLLREGNILKFVKDSSVLRPGYYIGLDTRNKLVIFGIRGTHTVYDLITDAVLSGTQDLSFEGFSTHFGTAEAARWYLEHEMETIRKCLQENKDFRLRIVGHSLGGAAGALLAMMLRKRSERELGFNPELVSAIGFGTPPCVSKELSEICASYVSTVVLQDDIIPRLSAASVARLRNEIIETDWMSILEKEDYKGIVDLVTNAKQVVSSVQDVARRLAAYAQFRKPPDTSENEVKRHTSPSSQPPAGSQSMVKANGSASEELFLPGTQYYLKRSVESSGASGRSTETYTLWKRQPGEHFQKILLSGNVISDHRCDSHYYALRDVLKSLPVSGKKNGPVLNLVEF